VSQFVLECWEGCGEEVAFSGPTHGSDALVEGVAVACPNCGQKYKLTQDGDGEVDLESLDESSLGSVVDDPDATHY
jgi:hypothetical protein